MSKTDTEKYLDKLEMEIFRAAKREIKLHAELKRLQGLLANAGLCDDCGLDYAGYADHEDACKCKELIE